MSTISDDTLSAFLDGELPDAERDRVAAALESDAVTAARLAQLQRIDAALKQAWPSGSTTLPAGIATALDRLAAAYEAQTKAAAPGNIVSLDARRASSARRSSRTPWRRWSLAASIIAIFGAGIALFAPLRIGETQFALLPANGAVLPDGHPLATTLSETASGTTRLWPGAANRAATVYPVMSFRDGTGALCREFEVADGSAVAMGVACRRQAGWTIEAIETATGRGSTSEGYVPAASAVPAAVETTIDRLMAGDPLDPPAEAAALAR